MHRLLLLLLVILGALLAFTLYCAALIDWIQDYSTGVYSQHIIEAILETGAILLYTYLGIKFFNRHIVS